MAKRIAITVFIARVWKAGNNHDAGMALAASGNK
jgi:hypothetical protein